ncbi:MAG: nucleotidyltransferase domain-containing protein [Bacteroidales bacterium]|nr:nucleotidyltransferase domain-containing protein [Bacteroidales bacterium]
METIDSIKKLARSKIPPRGEALLYGSRARGDFHTGSDWDVLILLDKDHLDQTDYNTISYPFVLLGCDLGEIINPIMYTYKEWEHYRITPFYENVMRDGILLT